jgi:hypothetical protein
LARFEHLEDIPDDPTEWNLNVRNAGRLSLALKENFDLALLFRRIATLELDAPTFKEVSELRWQGPDTAFGKMADKIDATALLPRIEKLAEARA